ncbi:MAG: 30S ribosome-binding factor RbfA [Chloroflexi bacterium]|nr:30S ribosome-binding factor RbfA [Chloroflexota bacterium]
MAHRIPKVNHLIQRELSDLLRRAKDPRLTTMVAVTGVATAPDLSHARVLVSIMGTPEEKATVLKALVSASRFFRRELADRLTLRRIPELEFAQDDSIERGAHLLELIDKAVKGDQA